MFKSQFYEDYLVDSKRETLGRTITETDIVMHAGQTGDFYPHHMDTGIRTTDGTWNIGI
jgi:acyl dehydratase